MVGGIHTVLATKSATAAARHPGRYLTIGPDVWRDSPLPPAFAPEIVFPTLDERLATLGVAARQGRWQVPGAPPCLLVDFSGLYAERDGVLAGLWEAWGVDSLFGGWDYVEPVLFGTAAARVIEALLDEAVPMCAEADVVAHFHEWMVSAGMLQLARNRPEVGTTFTTHATVVGRALSGEGSDLLRTLAREPDITALARERGVLAKHSIEAAAARAADAFTTVSETTADEATIVLGRTPDVITPNGLGEAYPPPEHGEPAARAAARARLLRMASACLGRTFDPERTDLLLSSGRPEFTNKGIDLAIDAVALLADEAASRDRDVLLLLAFPGDHTGPDRELLDAARGGAAPAAPRAVTHDLADPPRDAILQRMAARGLDCNPPDPALRVHALYLPIYLDGRDPLLPMRYFELLPAADLTLFPSHYEPWGYTPLESIGYGVPTVTSDLAGFGRWVAGEGDWEQTGARVLPRDGVAYDAALASLTAALRDWLATPPEQRAALGERALATARRASWDRFGEAYDRAHGLARLSARKRRREAGPRARKASFQALTVARGHVAPKLRRLVVKGELPPALARLRELAYNLAWSWQPAVAALFARLDPVAWAETGNPVLIVDRADPTRAAELAADPDYQASYQRACEQLDALEDPAQPPARIAYFCAEFGLADCLPLYSGGLGILAGDHLKAASDLATPLVAVGIAYRHGYFQQRIDAEGRQHNERATNDFAALPMRPLRDDQGDHLEVVVNLPGRPVYLRAWRVRVGRIDLYLLDADHDRNAPADRLITDALYGGDKERRLQQEIVLGIGGYRLLKRLGLEIETYHMNEGHSAFLALGRAKELVAHHQLKLDEALTYIRETSVFTTHTPVAAGHDSFDEGLMRPYFGHYAQALRTPWDELMALGRWPGEPPGTFSMTLLALRASSRAGGVSQIHGAVSRRMFHTLFPGFDVDEVPVGHVTNGVHTGSWLSPAIRDLIEGALGADWQASLAEDRELSLAAIEDAALWEAHRGLKGELIEALRRRVAARAAREGWPAARRRLTLSALDGEQEPLIVAFARRFAPYKRATLLFEDEQRLQGLIEGARQRGRPLLFLFAGKAHPADTLGQALIERIDQLSARAPFGGSVILLEGYSIDLARKLLWGADVWLNTPTRPLEASGTSGMKAAINGVPNLSVADGWWAEGYSGDNGWRIGPPGPLSPGAASPLAQVERDNAGDPQALIDLLEHELLPRFAAREGGLPTGWIAVMRRAIETALARFSAARMVADYQRDFYEPALAASAPLRAERYRRVVERAARRRRIAEGWAELRVVKAEASAGEGDALAIGQAVELSVELDHPGLAREDLLVEVFYGAPDEHDGLERQGALALEPEGDGRRSTWRGRFTPELTGPLAYSVRVAPRHPDRAAADASLKRVTWI